MNAESPFRLGYWITGILRVFLLSITPHIWISLKKAHRVVNKSYRSVITSYSIHYTKLYEELKKSPSAAVLKERKKKAQQREKAYAKKWPELDSLQLYRNLFQVKKNADFAVEELQARIPAAVWKETKDSLKNGTVQERNNFV